MSTEIENGMNTLKEAFKNDPDFAHSWHCNIAMMCYDAIYDAGIVDKGLLKNEGAHSIGNEAASRFMKLAFNVVTKA